MENMARLKDLPAIKKGWNLEHDYLLLATQENEKKLANMPGGCLKTEYKVEERLLKRLAAERDEITRQYGEHPNLSNTRILRDSLKECVASVGPGALRTRGIEGMRPWNLTLEWMYKHTCKEIEIKGIAIELYRTFEEKGPIEGKKLEEALERALYEERERRIQDFGKDEQLKKAELLRNDLKIRMAEEMKREISTRLAFWRWPRISVYERERLQLERKELDRIVTELREDFGGRRGLKCVATPEATAYTLYSGLMGRISRAGKDFELRR